MRLAEAVATLLRNPFEVDPIDLERRALELRALADAPKEVARAAVDAQAREGRKMLFATAHAEALGRSPERLQKLTSMLATLSELDGPRAARVGWALFRFYVAVDRFVGNSEVARNVRKVAWSVCFGASVHDQVGPSHVLLLGETGTGKELIAQALQAGAVGPLGDKRAPNQSVNAAVLTRELAVSELFGHVRGSFTSATSDRKGKIAEADGGTFFIDEFAELAPDVMGQLLRVMSSGEFSRLGSNQIETIAVRIIAATSKPAEELASTRPMRDLLARFTHRITIPALRDRPEDIAAIGRSLLGRGRAVGACTDEDENMSTAAAHREMLARHFLEHEAPKLSWPDNVRELDAAIQRIRIGASAPVAEGPVHTVDVPTEIVEATATEKWVLDWYYQRVLARTKSIREAAAVLGGQRRHNSALEEGSTKAWREGVR